MRPASQHAGLRRKPADSHGFIGMTRAQTPVRATCRASINPLQCLPTRTQAPSIAARSAPLTGRDGQAGPARCPSCAWRPAQRPRPRSVCHVVVVGLVPRRLLFALPQYSWDRSQTHGLRDQIDPSSHGLRDQMDPSTHGLRDQIEPSTHGLRDQIEPSTHGFEIDSNWYHEWTLEFVPRGDRSLLYQDQRHTQAVSCGRGCGRHSRTQTAGSLFLQCGAPAAWPPRHGAVA
jgi:hypothetical protein